MVWCSSNHPLLCIRGFQLSQILKVKWTSQDGIDNQSRACFLVVDVVMGFNSMSATPAVKGWCVRKRQVEESQLLTTLQDPKGFKQAIPPARLNPFLCPPVLLLSRVCGQTAPAGGKAVGSLVSAIHPCAARMHMPRPRTLWLRGSLLPIQTPSHPVAWASSAQLHRCNLLSR